jgi:hypothetical protein
MDKPNIVEVIGEHIALRKAGREFTGLCPFHADKTPSFSVSEEKGLFHCFACGAKGDVIRFVQEIEGIGFREAIALLGLQDEHRPKLIDTRKRRAAEKLARWLNEQHILVGIRLRQLFQQIGIAREIPNNEVVESLSREWEILCVLHDDLQRPKYAAELWEARDSIEKITAGIDMDPVPAFPPLTDAYCEHLGAQLC